MLFPDIILVNVLDLRLVSSVSWGFMSSPRLSFSSSAVQAMEADHGPEFRAEDCGSRETLPVENAQAQTCPRLHLLPTSLGQHLM